MVLLQRGVAEHPQPSIPTVSPPPDSPHGGHLSAPLGQRVVVRRVLPGETGPSGGPAMTDVLGVLEVDDGTTIAVRREDGELVTFPRADLVTGKPVPPRPSVRLRVDPAEVARLVALLPPAYADGPVLVGSVARLLRTLRAAGPGRDATPDPRAVVDGDDVVLPLVDDAALLATLDAAGEEGVRTVYVVLSPDDTAALERCTELGLVELPG